MPPVWPAADGDQQMQMHLDIEVDDLAAATGAVAAGPAPRRSAAPGRRHVCCFRDPAGHPFCLFVVRCTG